MVQYKAYKQVNPCENLNNNDFLSVSVVYDLSRLQTTSGATCAIGQEKKKENEEADNALDRGKWGAHDNVLHIILQVNQDWVAQYGQCPGQNTCIQATRPGQICTQSIHSGQFASAQATHPGQIR